MAAATLASLRIVAAADAQRAHLQHLVERFRAGAAALDAEPGDSPTPIQPLVVGSAERALRVSDALLGEGLLVTAIRPPTVPPNTARLRVTLSAAHTEAHVDRLLAALERHLGTM